MRLYVQRMLQYMSALGGYVTELLFVSMCCGCVALLCGQRTRSAHRLTGCSCLRVKGLAGCWDAAAYAG